ncbi:MAG: phospholipase D-like domain-containing protein, partial [Halobacteriota archaeon]
VLRVVVSVALAAAAVSAPVAADADARVVEIHPNPLEPGHSGEYVAVEFPEPTNTTGWTLEDGHREVDLPNETLEGTVYFGRERAPRNHSIGSLRLADAGGVVRIVSPSETVDSVEYGDSSDSVDAPREGESLVYDGEWRTRHVDATSFEYEEYEVDEVTAYVTPDAGDVALETLSETDDELLLAAFDVGGADVVDSVAASSRRANASVLVEPSPPGGLARETESALDGLDAAGADVYTPDGGQYVYHHAKYAVVDRERAVVTTENWDDGVAAGGPRGWGVVVDDSEVAGYLADVFEADVSARTTERWRDVGVESHEPAESYLDGPDTEFDPRSYDGGTVGVFVAPDDSVDPVVSLLESADSKAYVQLAYVDDWPDGEADYVDALLDAARRGVSVRVQLDGRWYVEEDNDEVVDRLRDVADSEDLDVEARVASEAVHTKGVVVDGETALVSSVNWNDHSPRENREAGVVVHHPGVAGYFEDVYLEDWNASRSRDGGSPDVYGGAAVALAAGSAAVYLALRRT